MGFEDIELKLLVEKGEEEFDQFSQFCEELLEADKKYGDVFLYALAASEQIGTHPVFKNDAFLIGGFGVLGHMMRAEGPDIVKHWRGSHDLDIACRNPEAMNYLVNTLGSDDHASNSLPDKRTSKLYDPRIEELVGRQSFCEADIYYPSHRRHPGRIRVATKMLGPKDFNNAQTVDVHGVPFRVYRGSDLLATKLNIHTGDNLPRKKDIVDIYNLLGAFERIGVTPERMTRTLEEDEVDRLVEVIGHTANPHRGAPEDQFILIPPTKRYLRDINDAYEN